MRIINILVISVLNMYCPPLVKGMLSSDDFDDDESDDDESDDADQTDCSGGIKGNKEWNEINWVSSKRSWFSFSKAEISNCEREVCMQWNDVFKMKKESPKLFNEINREVLKAWINPKECDSIKSQINQKLETNSAKGVKKDHISPIVKSDRREPGLSSGGPGSPERKSVEGPWKTWFYATLKIGT